jgi:hypothetical protein
LGLRPFSRLVHSQSLHRLHYRSSFYLSTVWHFHNIKLKLGTWNAWTQVQQTYIWLITSSPNTANVRALKYIVNWNHFLFINDFKDQYMNYLQHVIYFLQKYVTRISCFHESHLDVHHLTSVTLESKISPHTHQAQCPLSRKIWHWIFIFNPHQFDKTINTSSVLNLKSLHPQFRIFPLEFTEASNEASCCEITDTNWQRTQCPSWWL